jgi:hypothetical protein
MSKKKKKKNTPNLPNQTPEEKMEMKDTESFDQKSAAKKAVVLGTEKKKRPPLFAMLAIGVLVITVAAYLFMSNGQKSDVVVDGSLR